MGWGVVEGERGEGAWMTGASDYLTNCPFVPRQGHLHQRPCFSSFSANRMMLLYFSEICFM